VQGVAQPPGDRPSTPEPCRTAVRRLNQHARLTLSRAEVTLIEGQRATDDDIKLPTPSNGSQWRKLVRQSRLRTVLEYMRSRVARRLSGTVPGPSAAHGGKCRQ